VKNQQKTLAFLAPLFTPPVEDAATRCPAVLCEIFTQLNLPFLFHRGRRTAKFTR